MAKHYFVTPNEFGNHISNIYNQGHGVIPRYMIIAKSEIANLVNEFQRNTKDVFLSCLVLQKLSTKNRSYPIPVFRITNADCTDVELDEFFDELQRIRSFKSYMDFDLNGYNLKMIEKNCDYEAKASEAFWYYWGTIPSDIHSKCRLNISPQSIRTIAEKKQIDKFCQVADPKVELDDSIQDEAGDILAKLLSSVNDYYLSRLENLGGMTMRKYYHIINKGQSMSLRAA